jgi:catechol 2,3-dioxygenase-like lactoylglutathione lyase family enzyme
VLDHISIGVADLQRSMAFYGRVLITLGYVELFSDDDAACYGHPGRDDEFAIKRDRSGATRCSNRTHIAFTAHSREAVLAFHQAAMATGAMLDGPPELHPQYGPNYFAAFCFDPDGYRLEAVFHGV